MVLPIFSLARQFNLKVVFKDGVYLLSGAGYAFVHIDGAFKTPRRILRVPAEDGRLRFEDKVVVVERSEGLSPFEETLATEPYKNKLPTRNRERIIRGFILPNFLIPEWQGGVSLPYAISDHLGKVTTRRVSFSDGFATVLTPDCHLSTPIQPEYELGASFDMAVLLTALAFVYYSGALVESGLRFADGRGVYVFASALPIIKPFAFEGGDVLPAQNLFYRVVGNDAIVDLSCIDREPIRVPLNPFIALVRNARTVRIKVSRYFAMLETEDGIGNLKLRS